MLMYAQREDGEDLVAWDPSAGLPSGSSVVTSAGAAIMTSSGAFKLKLKKLLKDVQVDARLVLFIFCSQKAHNQDFVIGGRGGEIYRHSYPYGEMSRSEIKKI